MKAISNWPSAWQRSWDDDFNRRWFSFNTTMSWWKHTFWWTKPCPTKTEGYGWLRCGPSALSTSTGLGPIMMFQEAPLGKILERGEDFSQQLLDAWPLLPLTREGRHPVHPISSCFFRLHNFVQVSQSIICFRTSWITRSFDRRRSLCRDERDVEKNGWHMMARGKRRMLLTGLTNVTCYLLENKYDIGNTTI